MPCVPASWIGEIYLEQLFKAHVPFPPTGIDIKLPTN